MSDTIEITDAPELLLDEETGTRCADAPQGVCCKEQEAAAQNGAPAADGDTEDTADDAEGTEA